MAQGEQREHGRYGLTGRLVRMIWLQDGARRISYGELVDLGMGGIKAAMAEAPSKGRLVKVEADIGGLGMAEGDVEGTARVIEAVSSDGGVWMLRAAFDGLNPAQEANLRKAVHFLAAGRGHRIR